jgi:hypothetical protein
VKAFTAAIACGRTVTERELPVILLLAYLEFWHGGRRDYQIATHVIYPQ